MLRKLRITLAAFFFLGVTLLFVDVTDAARHWLGWMARVQFLPALMALNLGVIAGLVLLTLLAGRVYCSVICPLGVLQDIAARLGKRKRYRFRPARNRLRFGTLAAFALLSLAGVHSLALLLAPYSAYGRIAQNLFAPLYRLGNNGLARLAERADSYAFSAADIHIASLPTFVVAVLSFGVIVSLARRGGRLWCDTLCPVGAVLGLLARFAWLRPTLDRDKCVKCRACESRCKAGCIDIDAQTADAGRCVACMNCIEACARGAMRYGHSGGGRRSAPTADATARRAFLLALPALWAGASAARAAEENRADGGLAELKPRRSPRRTWPLRPPGASSQKNFAARCTACQLCVAACPNGVLRPGTSALGLMQPEMTFERGWCRPECVRCAEACPTGAIRAVTREEKTAVRIGAAVWDRSLCLPATDGDPCGNCERHCPNGSIGLIYFTTPGGKLARVPAVDAERCLGCGACEYVCPVRPQSAIRVDGFEVHRIN